MALSVSNCMGFQNPLSGIDHCDKKGLLSQDSCNMRAFQLRGCAIKSAAGACSSDRDNSSQVCDNHIDESVKKPELDAGFASFPASTKAEILWQ